MKTALQILQCRQESVRRARLWAYLLLAVLRPVASFAEGCPYPSASFPNEVPPLPAQSCATSPNMPARGQPVLQNFSVATGSGANFSEEYQRNLISRGWSIGETKTKKTAHGEMSHFEATHNNNLIIRLMIHGHGAHHGGKTDFTIAVQQRPIANSKK